MSDFSETTHTEICTEFWNLGGKKCGGFCGESVGKMRGNGAKSGELEMRHFLNKNK
jgi:hypothetical protein